MKQKIKTCTQNGQNLIAPFALSHHVLLICKIQYWTITWQAILSSSMQIYFNLLLCFVSLKGHARNYFYFWFYTYFVCHTLYDPPRITLTIALSLAVARDRRRRRESTWLGERRARVRGSPCIVRTIVKRPWGSQRDTIFCDWFTMSIFTASSARPSGAFCRFSEKLDWLRGAAQ